MGWSPSAAKAPASSRSRSDSRDCSAERLFLNRFCLVRRQALQRCRNRFSLFHRQTWIQPGGECDFRVCMFSRGAVLVGERVFQFNQLVCEAGTGVEQAVFIQRDPIEPGLVACSVEQHQVSRLH